MQTWNATIISKHVLWRLGPTQENCKVAGWVVAAGGSRGPFAGKWSPISAVSAWG